MNAKQMRELGNYLNGPIGDEWMEVEENFRTRSVTLRLGKTGEVEPRIAYLIDEDGERSPISDPPHGSDAALAEALPEGLNL